MSRYRLLSVGLLTLALTLETGATDLGAQQRRGMGQRAPDRAQLEQRVRARFAEVIKERLGLTDEQARVLNGTMESFMEPRQRLMQEEQSLRRRRDAILVDPEPSSEEAASLLARMVELRREEARLFEEEQRALLEILTPVQLVRFHASREQLAQRIQQLRGGGGPPGPPGGPGEWNPDLPW